jgi:DNA-binding transcriptional regulator LsrR (DeoR family)
MNETDLKIIEMHYEDGLKESEIAERLNLSTSTIREVLFEFERGDIGSMFEE